MGTLIRRASKSFGGLLLIFPLMVVALGCPAGEEEPIIDTTAMNPPAASGGGGGDVPPIIALGDSVYHGQIPGGICFTCHGPNAEGSSLAPSLTDQQWIHGDGSLEMITNIVRTGVQQPQQFAAPMPAFGGTLNDQQIAAVSAYIYSLSHPGQPVPGA